MLAARQRLGERLLTAFDDTTDRFNHLATRLSAAEAETACTTLVTSSPVRTFLGYGSSNSSSMGGISAPHWNPRPRYQRKVRPS